MAEGQLHAMQPGRALQLLLGVFLAAQLMKTQGQTPHLHLVIQCYVGIQPRVDSVVIIEKNVKCDVWL